MALRENLLVPSTSTLLFTLHFLYVFLGQRTSGDLLSEGPMRDGRGSNLQMDVFSMLPVASEGRDNRMLSTQTQGIKFEPSVLDFREQSVGMPKLEIVEIHNPSHSQPLHLNSISGDSPVFHASFFRSKVLKAGESTTFDVIFLARLPESVQTALYIQTSLGTFDYKVQGVGVPNKFRLRSLLGARIPLNATYSPLISMYNPFNSSLQITEMYSSGGDLHLELLSGMPHGSKTLWEIRPYETKAIGRANFFGRMETNHTSFIRIKTMHVSSPSIVLPVEVEVSESPSLFLSREILDFGILKSGESKTLPLYVLNSGPQQVHIKSITIEPENGAIDIEYTSIVLKPGSKYTKIAMITFYSDRVSTLKQTSGMLTVKANGRTAHQLEVPFEANVLHGSLSYEKSKTLFRVGRPPFHPMVHQIPLANRFKVPVVIYDVKLPSKALEFFSVSSLTEPFILPPDSEWYYPFSIRFLPSSSDCLFNTTLRLSTNSTYFTIPLHCYDGRVKYSVEGAGEEEDTLDYGILSEIDSRSRIFTLHNVNPVEIQISSFTVSAGLPYTSVELLSIHPTNQSSTSSSPPNSPYIIDVGHSASFRVNVTRPESKGTFSGEILVYTSFDHLLHVPVYYKTAIGGLRSLPEDIYFKPTFPYGIAEVPLYVENLYHYPVTVMSVYREPSDARFYFRPISVDGGYPLLKPKEIVHIGTAVFDPLLEADGESVYLGMGSRGSWSRSYIGTSSFSGGGVKLSDPTADLKHFSSLWESWNSLLEEGINVLNFSYVVMPDFGAELSVPGTATLVWPNLLQNVEGNLIEFPTTTIGNSHLQVLNLTNPSHRPLMMQPVLLQHYTRSQSVVNLLSEQLDADLQNVDFHQTSSSSFSFSREHISFDTDSSLMSRIVQPDDPYQITVAFSPKVESVFSTLLLIRNNLTILDYVLLRGQGIQGVFSINGIQPSSDPLLFELTQTMMESCQAGPLSEPMKISRIFSMYNSGVTPLTLYLVGVGAGGREEGGFTVVNYNREIIIKPNKTKSIEISFTPDFTISQVSNTLRFKTSSGTELLFPLLALLPHNLLAVCYAMQPRPEWEQTIAWLSVPFWISVLVIMVVIVLMQTNFGMSSEISYHNDNALPLIQATGGQVFDLRNITSLTNSNTRSSCKPPEMVRHTSHNHHVQSSFVSKPATQPSSPEECRRSKVPQASSVPNPTKQASTTPTDFEIKLKNGVLDHPAPKSLNNSSNEDRLDKENEQYFTLDSSSKDVIHDSSLKQSLYSQLQSSPLHSVSSPEVKLPQLPSPLSEESTSELSPTDSTRGIKQVHTTATSSVETTTQPDPKSLEMLELDLPVQPDFQSTTPPHVPAITETSPTTGVAFVPPSSRKLKGSRKANSKIQKSSHLPVESAANTPSFPSVAHTPGPSLLSQALKRDSLERKESESSLKSTDSESTTSSGDKSDEKDYSENTVVSTTKKITTVETNVVPVSLQLSTKTKPQQLPLTKEPNTGQTMHISESPDDPEGEEGVKKDASGNMKGGKSKRKLRQQKKEEKLLKKKERERSSIRVRDKAERTRSLAEDSSYSTEQFEDETPEAIPATKGIKAKLSSIPSKYDPNPKNKPKMPVRYVQAVDHRAFITEPYTRKTPELVESFEERNRAVDVSLPHLLPSPSVPSTAIKNSKPHYEDIYSDPFSRNPDRSTYASKKAGSKKSSDRGGKLEVDKSPVINSAKHIDVIKEEMIEGKRDPNTAEGSDESVGEETEYNMSPEELDGDTHENLSNKKQGGPNNRSSPHDLAASLLSKMKYKQSDRAKSVESIDFEEEDLEIMKPETVKANKFKKVNPPPSLSPMKDESLLSPSSPLSNDQYKISTLSLDAEPFYPSSNFKSKKHHSRYDYKTSGQRSEGKNPRKMKASDPRVETPVTNGRMSHSVKLTQQHGKIPTSLPLNGNVSYMVPHSEKAMLDRAEYIHQHSEKSSTPSPYANMYSDPQSYGGFGEQPFDAQEPASGFRRSNERTLGAYYNPNIDTIGFNEQLRHDPSAQDLYLIPKNRQMPSISSVQKMAGSLYQQQKQQQQISGYPPPPPGYTHESLRMHQFDDDFKRQQFFRKRKFILDLYRQERAALAAAYAREQARKSAEALSSLHRPSRMMFSSHDANRHMLAGSPMWEDYMESITSPQKPHPLRGGSDDPVGNEPDSRLMNHPYVISDTSRARTLSENSELGGEMIPNYQSVVQSPTAVGPPGYKLAPGAEYSRVEQQQDQEDGEGNSLIMEQELKGLTWPPEEDISIGADWEGSDNSWMLESPFNTSNTRDLNNVDLTSDPNLSGINNSNQPYVSNTYELFENQSIWSLNNSGSNSSNLLSWAILGAEQNKNSDQVN